MFNCGTGPAVIKDPTRTDNGQWHTVEIIREAKRGSLVVDEVIVAEGESAGHTESINVDAPYYIGGLPEEVATMAKKALVGFLSNFSDFLPPLSKYLKCTYALPDPMKDHLLS